MSYYFHRTPGWLQKIYPSLTWKVSDSEKTIYLTFDDGPIPDVTSFVLSELDKYHAKATFFCVGENIQKHPDEFNKVLEKGHSVGNHTYNHLTGWKTTETHYVENVKLCQKEIERHLGAQDEKLFRPPHGKITRSQIREVSKDYEIIMWTYLTGDFDIFLEPEECREKAISRVEPDHIVVFHDSVKSYANLRVTLPAFLRHFNEKGYQFNKL
ncbi:MAG: polysaccharide deacetylase family protein [Cyclobacteriaceae bacterium]